MLTLHVLNLSKQNQQAVTLFFHTGLSASKNLWENACCVWKCMQELSGSGCSIQGGREKAVSNDQGHVIPAPEK